MKAFLERVWKTISEWFLKNKKAFKKFEDLVAEELDWMSSRRIGSLGGKVLKSSQIRKLRGILKQKGIKLIVEGDVKSITRNYTSIEKKFFFIFKTYADNVLVSVFIKPTE